MTPTPITEHEGSMASFMAELAYPPHPGRDERYAGDIELLALLDHRNRRGPLRSLERRQIYDAVLAVETRHFGRWKLDGQLGDDVFDRLDAHFAIPQQAAAAAAAAREQEAIRRGRETEELDRELERQAIEQTRALWNLPWGPWLQAGT